MTCDLPCFIFSLVRSYLETVAQSCVAVQGTTLLTVLITPVTPLKNVARLMVLQAAILKVTYKGIGTPTFTCDSKPVVSIVKIFLDSDSRLHDVSLPELLDTTFTHSPLCVISSGTSTCIASGDPHYTSFDKRKYNFMGNCSYLMSGPCNGTFSPYFEVHADNENRHNNPRISYVKAVHVYVHQVKISILKGGTVQVRNEGNNHREILDTVLYSISSIITLYVILTCFPHTGKWDQCKPASVSGPWCLCVQVRKTLHSVHGLWCDCSL